MCTYIHRYVLRNRPESLADLREPVIEAFSKFIDLLGMVQVHYIYTELTIVTIRMCKNPTILSTMVKYKSAHPHDTNHGTIPSRMHGKDYLTLKLRTSRCTKVSCVHQRLKSVFHILQINLAELSSISQNRRTWTQRLSGGYSYKSQWIMWAHAWSCSGVYFSFNSSGINSTSDARRRGNGRSVATHACASEGKMTI